MKKLLTFLLLLATALSGLTTTTQAADERIFDLPYLMRDLDNGLRVIVVRTDYPDIVNLQIPVQSGSRNEIEPGKSGFAHFFEHMMFKGTENRSAEEYRAILKNAGADQNAYTTDDYTNYHITFTKSDLETVLELEADRFRNLSYSEEVFRTEAQAVKGEYLKNNSNPIRKMLEVIRDNSFTTHTYKHTTMGFFEDIEAMPDQLEYARTFFDRWYRPEKAAIIVVGDVDPEATFAMVKKHWGEWEHGGYTVDIPAEPAPNGPLNEHLQWEAPTQPWIMMGFRGPAFDPGDKAMPAMDIVSEIYLSESSDLYRKLVIEDQSVDQMFPYFPNRKDPMLLYVAARLAKPEAANDVRDAILSTLARARTETLDNARLEATKARLKYSFAGQMDNSEAIGSILATIVQYDRNPEDINELYRTYDAITADDIRTLAARYFNDKGLITLTLSNDEQMAGLSEAPSIDALSAAMGTAPSSVVKMVQMQSAASPLVDVSFLFNVGPALDPPGKRGLAALTAAMISGGGSERHTIDELNEAYYPIASGFAAQVDKEMTRLAGTVHKDNLATWYALASEQLLTPGWRQSDLDRLKTNAINGIRTGLIANNDEELGKEALYSFIYGDDHAYGHLNLGAAGDIESITLDDVRGFYEKHYTQANLTLGLAGGYTDAFRKQLSGDLAALAAGTPSAPRLKAAPAIDGRHAMIVQKETLSVAVSFGFPIDVRRGDKDFVALWLARSWLGEHRSSNSHLYQRIRSVRGMNYGDYAYIEYFPRGMFLTQPDANHGRQHQIFQVWLRPLRSNNDAHFATRTALYELDKLIDNGMSQEDFEATRKFLSKFASLLTASQSRQLGYQLDSDYYGTPAFAEYIREELGKLTLGQVNRAIRKHLQTDDIKFVFISSDAEDLKSRLAGDQPSPLEYNAPKPELADEDAVIQVLPLMLSGEDIDIVSSEDIFQ